MAVQSRIILEDRLVLRLKPCFPFLAVSDDVRVSFLSGYAILCTLNLKQNQSFSTRTSHKALKAVFMPVVQVGCAMVMLDSLPRDGREVDAWHDVQEADGAGWLSKTRGARPQVHFCASLPFVAGSHSSVGLLLEDQIRLTLCNMVPCFLVMFHSLG
jgi:hypothetical protein